MLRNYAALRGWEIVQEYVDQASATDLRGRKAWRELVGHVQKGGLDLVLVTKLDRAFRSAKDTYDSLAYLEQHNVGFIAARLQGSFSWASWPQSQGSRNP